MSEESGFSSYAAARWATAVRVGVLLGLPPWHAADLAVVALARLAVDWTRHDDRADLDVTFYGLLLEVIGDDRTPWWSGGERWEQPVVETTALAEIEPALDALDLDARARLVLAGVARLEPEQLDDVLPGRDRPHAAGPAPESVGFAAGAVAVPPYVDSDVGAVALRGQRRRQALRATGGVVGLVLVLAVALLVVRQLEAATGLPRETSTSSVGSGLRSPTPVGTVTGPPGRIEQQVPVWWYAADRLHLGPRAVQLSGVVGLGSLGEFGVVVGFADGRLARVSTDGELIGLGRAQPGSGFAVEVDQLFVAWLDRTGREVVVRDLAAGVDVVRLPVVAGSRVVAIDSGLTYVADATGYSIVRVGTALPDRYDGVTLLDAASGTLATAPRPGRIRLQRAGEAPINAAGSAVDLSDDGRYALVQQPPGAGRGSTYAVIDVQDGTSIRLTLPDGGTPVDAAFSTAGLNREVVFVVFGGAAPYDLVVCDLRVVSCRDAAQVRDARFAPLLAK